MTITHDIVQKLWKLCSLLRNDGGTYHQYVTELNLRHVPEYGSGDECRGLVAGRQSLGRPSGEEWAGALQR